MSHMEKQSRAIIKSKKHGCSVNRPVVCRDLREACFPKSERPPKISPNKIFRGKDGAKKRSELSVFPTDTLQSTSRNYRRARNRRLWRFYNRYFGESRPEKAQEAWRRKNIRLENRQQFKIYKSRVVEAVEPNQKTHKNKGDKVPYGFPFKAATLNVRGLNGDNGITKRQHVTQIMKQEGVDIMLLTETHVNHSSTETHNDFGFFFSSDVKPGQNSREYAGVGVVLHKKLRPFLYEVNQKSSRLMVVKLRSKGKNVSFICCYAPQSGHSTETKEDFYDDLQTVYSECQEAVFLGGDFNARIHHRYDSELDIMGPNIFGRGREYLERVSSNTKENRDLLVDFCRANMLRILNTDFYKPLSKQATFRENATPVGGPIAAENHAQLDFWLTHARQRNLCTDVQSRTDIYMQTDHYMVELSFRVKLSAAEHQKHNQVAPKFSKPSEYQWKQYNDFIHSRVSLAHGDLDIDQFAQTLMTAADICLSKDTVPRKKDYLSHRTRSLISDRQELFTQGLSDEVKALDRQIKKEARADKRRHIINQFHHAPGDPFRKKTWKVVHQLRSDFKPSYVAMRDSYGRRVPLPKRAETIAEYLFSKHWSNEAGNGPLPFQDNIGDPLNCDPTPFTADELDMVLKNSKSNKQPGPDRMPMELFKWLNRCNRSPLLRILNNWWTQGEVPQEILHARVVPIFKKGNIDDSLKLQTYFFIK